MLKDADEGIAFERIVGRSPVGEAFHVVLAEKRDGVIAETA
jgi:hypothetical protein